MGLILASAQPFKQLDLELARASPFAKLKFETGERRAVRTNGCSNSRTQTSTKEVTVVYSPAFIVSILISHPVEMGYTCLL